MHLFATLQPEHVLQRGKTAYAESLARPESEKITTTRPA